MPIYEVVTKKFIHLLFFQPLEIHETVAECMIFANHWVAMKIAEAFPSAALVRCHRCFIN